MSIWIVVVLVIVAFDVGFVFGAWWASRDRDIEDREREVLYSTRQYKDKEVSKWLLNQ